MRDLTRRKGLQRPSVSVIGLCGVICGWNATLERRLTRLSPSLLLFRAWKLTTLVVPITFHISTFGREQRKGTFTKTNNYPRQKMDLPKVRKLRGWSCLCRGTWFTSVLKPSRWLMEPLRIVILQSMHEAICKNVPHSALQLEILRQWTHLRPKQVSQIAQRIVKWTNVPSSWKISSVALLTTRTVSWLRFDWQTSFGAR